MITAGIDVGIENTKVVILRDGKVLATKQTPTRGAQLATSAKQVWNEILEAVKLAPSDVTKVIATGQGKNDVKFSNGSIVEPLADARAAAWLYPSARSVVDVGCDQARAMNFDAKGNVIGVVLNQKCAAGIGMFLNSLPRMLGMTMEEMSRLSGNGRSRKVFVNERCCCFSEMDIHSLLLNDTPKEDVILAIFEAAATRINSMLNEKITIEKDVVLIGGVARNAGVVKALKKRSGIDFLIPEQPEFAGALGAAIHAAGLKL
jgi:predicted CoA-substrate-specific enzyme activase